MRDDSWRKRQRSARRKTHRIGDGRVGGHKFEPTRAAAKMPAGESPECVALANDYGLRGGERSRVRTRRWHEVRLRRDARFGRTNYRDGWRRWLNSATDEWINAVRAC